MKSEYRTTSVRAVIRKGDKILVEWFAPKAISFLPGGTIEPNEDIELALIRELDEELQHIELEVVRYLGKIGHHWGTANKRDSCLNHFYEVALKNDFGVSARESGRQIKWMSLDSVEAQTLQPPSLKQFLTNPMGINWDYTDQES